MMLYRIATVFTILFMAVFGSASAVDIVARTDPTPTPPPPPPLPPCPAGTGPISCCESVQSNTSGLGPILIGIITALLGPIVPQIGLTCSPVLSIVQANACTGQTVCCSGNAFNGIANIGCTPISINL